MAVTYTLRSRTAVLPRADVVLAFWKKGDQTVSSGAEKRQITRMIQRMGAQGEAHELTVIPLPRGPVARTLLLIGLGDEPTLDVFRRGVATAVQYARQAAVQEIAIVTPSIFHDGEAIGAACVEGVELGRYLFTKYQAEMAKRERTRGLRHVVFFASPKQLRFVKEGIRLGTIIAKATILARDLVNEPASHITPKALADDARRIARAPNGSVRVQILDRAQCEAKGMGAFLAVAQGSIHPPYFIHLTYEPVASRSKATKRLPVVALVGKGITFDSGGLSLKPAEGMETMKIDMAGAASVFAVFSALSALNVQAVVHGFVAACENMPSGSAMRPGDIVRSASGKTIEIRNTDAEGRLTLADALTLAQAVKPDVLIDLATLTGACVVSLGEEVAGVFANDERFAAMLTAAAHRAGEAVWELPLVPEYREQIKSAIADLRNITGRRWAGAITAALFLQEFVGKTPWIHMDIAGPSYAEQQTNPVVPVGASGFGVRTLLRFLLRLTEEERDRALETKQEA